MQNDTLQSIAETFNPEYRAFVESDYVNTIAFQLGEKYQLTDSDIVVVRNGYLLHLHFVLLNSELTNFLTEEAQLDSATAQAITEDFLSDLPSEYTSQHDAVVSEYRNPDSAKPQAVTPVRTMANDMEQARDEQTYSSNQDAILQNNQTPQDPDTARWQQT